MKPNLLPLMCLMASVSVSSASPIPPAQILVNKSMMWADAQAYCKSFYIDLTVSKNPSDWVTLTNEIVKYGVTGPVWMGLNQDFDAWRFSMNDFPLKNITLRNWGHVEPNNFDGHEWCVAIDAVGLWKDTNCADVRSFVCYDGGAGKFVGVGASVNWSVAQTYCRLHYTDLASSLNTTDNNQIVQITSYQGFSWFGLFRDGWKWVDGTKVDLLLWQTPLPDNAIPQENCGTFNAGKLDDKQCTNKFYFFCDAIRIRKKVFKLWVKTSDGVLDPAVEAAILQQIHQKIDVMLSVSWRVHPDGKVFHKVSLY